MKHTLHYLVPTLYLMLLCLTSGNLFAGNKVTICHIPPGNPDNAHSITVSESAIPAHLAHGDSIGECPESEEEGSSTESMTTVVSYVGASYVICDDREGETGRSVNISLIGRILTDRIECD